MVCVDRCCVSFDDDNHRFGHDGGGMMEEEVGRQGWRCLTCKCDTCRHLGSQLLNRSNFSTGKTTSSAYSAVRRKGPSKVFEAESHMFHSITPWSGVWGRKMCRSRSQRREARSRLNEGKAFSE